MTAAVAELVKKLRALGPGGHTLRATEHHAHGWAHEIAADELERLEKHKDILARALLLAQQEREVPSHSSTDELSGGGK